MSKDYYNILGVAKSASADEIKKAFRTKAHEYHPDKPGGNNDKFKEINEAYQVLGDEQKRQQYDQYGSDFSGQNFGGASGFNWNDFAQGGFQQGNANFDMGDLGDLFGDFFGGGRSTQRRTYRGEDVEMNLSLDFREAVYGVTKKVSLNLQNKCDKCEGTGGEPNSELITCKTCNGSGQVISVKKTVFGNIQSASACGTCEGRGKYYEKKCTKCGGRGRTAGIRTIAVEIPAGIENGTTVKIIGQGNAGPYQSQAGDLYLTVQVKADPTFQRKGATIFTTEKIPFSLAVMGGKIEVKTIDGQESLKIPSGTPSNTVFTLRNAGAPRFQRNGRGDHEVTVIVDIPKNTTKDQKEILKKLEDAGL